jgi:hypothetical protein
MTEIRTKSGTEKVNFVTDRTRRRIKSEDLLFLESDCSLHNGTSQRYFMPIAGIEISIDIYDPCSERSPVLFHNIGTFDPGRDIMGNFCWSEDRCLEFLDACYLFQDFYHALDIINRQRANSHICCVDSAEHILIGNWIGMFGSPLIEIWDTLGQYAGYDALSGFCVSDEIIPVIIGDYIAPAQTEQFNRSFAPIIEHCQECFVPCISGSLDNSLDH